MPTNNCTGGQTATLQVINNDCSCVSISSITWNNAGTQFTITLDNGQSITSPVLTGPAGTPITPEFRVSGTYLQYSVDSGATWTNLYDLSLIESAGVLENLISNSATAGTAWETLKSYTLTAGTLSADKDILHIRARVKSNGTIQGQECRVQFNGSTLASAEFSDSTDFVFFDIYLSRISQTTAKYEGQLQVGQGFLSVTILTGIFTLPVTSIAGLDFDANNYAITIQGDSVVVGDVICEELQVIYVKKT